MRRSCHAGRAYSHHAQICVAVKRVGDFGACGHGRRWASSSAATDSMVCEAIAERSLAHAFMLLQNPIVATVELTPVNATHARADTRAVDLAGSPLPTALRWVLEDRAVSADAPSPTAPLDGVDLWRRRVKYEEETGQYAHHGDSALQPYVISVSPPSPTTGSAVFEEVPLSAARYFISAATEHDMRQRWSTYQRSSSAMRQPTNVQTQSRRRRRVSSVAVDDAEPHAAPMFYWRAFSADGVFMGYGIPLAAIAASSHTQSRRGSDAQGALRRRSSSPFWVPRHVLRVLPHFALPPPCASTRLLHRMSRSQRVRLNLFFAALYSTNQLRQCRTQIHSALTQAKSIRAQAARTSAYSEADRRVQALLAPLPKVLGDGMSSTLLPFLAATLNTATASRETASAQDMNAAASVEEKVAPTGPSPSGHQGYGDDDEEAFMALLLIGAPEGTATGGPTARRHRARIRDADDHNDPATFYQSRAVLSGLSTFWARGAASPHSLPFTFYFPNALYPYLLALFRRHWQAYMRADHSHMADPFHRAQTFSAHAPLSDWVVLHGGDSHALDLADALAVTSQSIENADASHQGSPHRNHEPDNTRRCESPVKGERKVSQRRYGALYATTEEVLEDVLFAIDCELGVTAGGRGGDGENAPHAWMMANDTQSTREVGKRRAHHYGPIYASSYGHAVRDRRSMAIVTVLGDEYVNAGNLAVGGVIDSTLCAAHGFPLDDQGLPLLTALPLVRSALQYGGDAFVPSVAAGEGQQTGTLATEGGADQNAGSRSYQSQWDQFSREERARAVGLRDTNSSSSASSSVGPTPASNMWLRSIRDLQEGGSRRRAATDMLRFQSFREKIVEMRRWHTRCRLRYTSPYWLRKDTLPSRWGVEHVKGDPVLVNGELYVNAEQTSNASKFTAATCAPSRTHQVLCPTGLHTCGWQMSAALEALLKEVQQERGLDRTAVDARLWVMFDVVEQARWPIPRNAAVADVDLDGLLLSTREHQELEQILSVTSTTDSAVPPTAGVERGQPPAPTGPRPRRRVRIVHASDIAARAELVFLLTYRPIILVGTVAEVAPVDAGYAACHAAAERLRAVSARCEAASPHATDEPGTARHGSSQNACKAAAAPSRKKGPKQAKSTALTAVRYAAEDGGLCVPGSSCTPTAAAFTGATALAALEHARVVHEQYWIAAVSKKKRAYVAQHYGKRTLLEHSSRITLALVALTTARDDRDPERQVWVSESFLSSEALVTHRDSSPAPTTIFLLGFRSGHRAMRRKLTVWHWSALTWPADESSAALRSDHLKWVSLLL